MPPLERHRANWFVRETIGMLRRTLARLDVTSRTLYALIEPGSCFAGTLAELALAADRSYMLALPDDAATRPEIHALRAQFRRLPDGQWPRATRRRASTSEAEPIARAKEAVGRALDAAEALALGLVTAAPDDLDWADEVRVALEERASLSPDALTGMEANLRFGVAETMADARLRPALGVAELDLHPTQRVRRSRRAEGIRHRQQGQIQLGTRLTSPAYRHH